ncbi:MAG: hypothetical protein JKY52_08520 [Flavobacteriales bacterium]|nr:hypothetical protein [Flavobacteriales bacterium]
MTDVVIYTVDSTGARVLVSDSNPLPTSPGTGSINSTDITTSTTTGSTTSGALGYEILNIGASNGTIDGVTFAPNEGFMEEGYGSTLSSISFNATGTTFRITERTS